MRLPIKLVLTAAAFMAAVMMVEAKEGVRLNREAAAKFRAAWGAAKDLKGKLDAVEALPGGDAGLIGCYQTATEDPRWSIRIQATLRIRGIEVGAGRDAYIDAFRKEKKETTRAQMLWNLAVFEDKSDSEWKVIREVLQDVRESMRVRITAARLMETPLQQDLMKANFEALLATLTAFNADDKIQKRLDKDKVQRQFKWLLVYAMERLTSEEWGDSVAGWDTWWNQNKTQPLKYRQDNKVQSEVSGVKVEGRTAVRKKVKKVTNTELLLIPDFGHTTAQFDPYLYEFAQFFKFTPVSMPDAAPLAEKRLNNEAYYYPMRRVADLFEERRKSEGSSNVGILAVGGLSFIAMEYAARNPGSAAFIICVGCWSTFAEQGEAGNQLRNHKDPVFKWYGESLIYNRSPALNEVQRAEANDGMVRHLFSDPFHLDHFLIASSGLAQRTSAQTPLIDPEYRFEARTVNVPALFIFGKDDVMFRKGTDTALQKVFKKSKFVTMDNVSRMPWLEDPIGFHDIFNDFMNEFKVWEKIEKEAKPAEAGK